MASIPSFLEIDLDTLVRNLRAVQGLIGPDCGVCAVIKADGYGLGAVPIAKGLSRHGASLLAVYNPQQAEPLLEAGVDSPLLLLMPVEDLPAQGCLADAIRAGRVNLTVHGVAHLEQVIGIAATLDCVVPVQVEVDTGMSRAGADLDEFGDLVERIAADDHVRLVGVFSHPSSADDDADVTEQQWNRFTAALDAHDKHIGPDVVIHFANSPGMLRSERYHQRMVRIGLSLLGHAQPDMVGPTEIASPPELRPIVRWMSQVVRVRDVPAGTAIGYNGRYVTQRASTLGLVPVGYADGYRRLLSNRAVVRVGDALMPAPVRGSVSMDQIVIDLTDGPAMAVGTPVEVISNDPTAPNALHKLAAQAETISYEILCGLSARLPRVYREVSPEAGSS